MDPQVPFDTESVAYKFSPERMPPLLGFHAAKNPALGEKKKAGLFRGAFLNALGKE